MPPADDLLEGLNDAQRAAVAAPDVSCMILAGAGSGKTRVLTHRIAWLHRHHGIPLHGILAVTFTNKAAGEMRERMESLVGNAQGLWAGTFHGIAHRLLRLHANDAGLPETFQILDSDDQLKLVKQVAQDAQLDDTVFAPRALTAWINAQKDEGLDPRQAPASDAYESTLRNVYEAYQTRCDRLGLVDFGELLLRARTLLRDRDAVRTHYQERFGHILVDEFQDTNRVQYDLVRLWAGETGRVFAVGDVDQCLMPGTPVRMADGTWRAVERVRAGMLLATRDPAGDPRRVLRVSQVWHAGDAIDLTLDTGQVLSSTGDHTHLIARPPSGFRVQAPVQLDLVLCGQSSAQGTAHRLVLKAGTPEARQWLAERGITLNDGEPRESTFVHYADALELVRHVEGPDVSVTVSAQLSGCDGQRVMLWPVRARDVLEGDEMLGDAGRLVRVEAVDVRYHEGRAYDLDVDTVHHFVAQGVVTHNCIYGWRGSKAEHVSKFIDEFPGAQLLRLEQNYRSTQTILSAANALIQNNPNRLEKNLWTEGETGEPILLYTAQDERDEARFVVRRVETALAHGAKPTDFAVLYRSNAQSRALEEALLARRVPYRITGGVRFFERAEIKDAMAYLRLVSHRTDDPAFVRVLNTPPRGLGEKTLQAIERRAAQTLSGLWQAAKDLVREKALPARASGALGDFLADVESWTATERHLPLPEAVAAIVAASGLREHHSKQSRNESDVAGTSRLDNLNELVSVAARFAMPPEDKAAGLDAWSSFLTHAALEAGDTQRNDGPCVELMTIHAAKGLEFPHVFLVGLEEGLFPNGRGDGHGRVEEERRLAYVGITRAEKTLTLCHAVRRRLYGTWIDQSVSRFVEELPVELVHAVRSYQPMGGRTPPFQPFPSTRHPLSSPQNPGKNSSTNGATRPGTGPARVARSLGAQWRAGDLVDHPQWGRGVVARVEHGDNPRLQIAFRGHGLRWVERQGVSAAVVKGSH